MAEEGKVDDVNAGYYDLKKELADRLDRQEETWKQEKRDIVHAAEVALEQAHQRYEEEKKRQEKEYDELFRVTDLRVKVSEAQSRVEKARELRVKADEAEAHGNTNEARELRIEADEEDASVQGLDIPSLLQSQTKLEYHLKAVKDAALQMLHKNLQITEKQIEDKKQEELKRLDQNWTSLIDVTKTHFKVIMDAQLEAFKKKFHFTNSSWVSKKKRSRRALRSRSVGKKTSKVRKKKARRHVKHKKQK